MSKAEAIVDKEAPIMFDNAFLHGFLISLGYKTINYAIFMVKLLYNVISYCKAPKNCLNILLKVLQFCSLKYA